MKIFHHVCIQTENYNQSLEFYTKILGLTLEDEKMGLRFSLPGNSGSVFVYQKDEHQPASYTVLNFVVDDINEAEKVLVKEVTQTFFSVADDVFLNVRFNPAVIKDYRLVGFDNKKDAIADSTGELEGGEIGSGNSVLAIFEITPATNESFIDTTALIEPAQVSLKYTLPATKIRRVLRYQCPNNYLAFNNIDKEFQLGAAIGMFGMKLRQSKYFPYSNWSEIERIANSAYDPTNYLQKQFVQLIACAKKIYVKKRMKKRN